MNEATLTGYHTTHIDNLKSILNNGFYMSKPNKEHWLGKGVYFFYDLYYAIEWKIIGILKKDNIEDNSEVKNTCVITANIESEGFETLDLSIPTGYEVYKTFLEILKDNYSEEEYKSIVNQGDKYIIKALEKLEIVKKEKYLSAFDIVSACYYRNTNNKKIDLSKKSDFLVSIEKQICVKNYKAIKDIKEFKDSCVSNDILELVKKNRSEEND